MNAIAANEMTQNAMHIRATGETRMNALLDSASLIESPAVRGHVTALVHSAIVNANDTVDVENAATNEEWYSVANSTLRGLIDDDNHATAAAARRWFIDASRAAVA